MRSPLGKLPILLGLLLLWVLLLRPDLVLAAAIAFTLGGAVVASTPWFMRWLEGYLDRIKAGASYWCRRCRVGTANPLCWSCKQRDKTERSRPRNVA